MISGMGTYVSSGWDTAHSFIDSGVSFFRNFHPNIKESVLNITAWLVLISHIFHFAQEFLLDYDYDYYIVSPVNLFITTFIAAEFQTTKDWIEWNMHK